MKVNNNEQGSSIAPSFTQRCLDTCRKILDQIADVKSQVLSEFKHRVAGQQRLLELAVNEAEALAWQTDFPHLLFPALAAEKATAVAGWNSRQEWLYRQTLPALAAA